MKKLLRIAMTMVFCAVLCLCITPAGFGEETLYTNSFNSISVYVTNGTLTFSSTAGMSNSITSADAGQTVYFTATPNSGYMLDSVSVVSAVTGTVVSTAINSYGVRSFVMPEGGVNVYATFKGNGRAITFIVDPPDAAFRLTVDNMSSTLFGGPRTFFIVPGTVVKIDYATTDYDTITLTSASGRGVSGNQYTVSNADDTVTITLSKTGTADDYITIDFCGYTAKFSGQLFKDDSSLPNNDLALFSGILSQAVYGDEGVPTSYDIYDALGIPRTDVYEWSKNGYDFLNSIAKKEIYIDGQKTLLLMITARGTKTFDERMGDHFTNANSYFYYYAGDLESGYWAYDNINTFQEEIWEALDHYTKLHPDVTTEKLKILITGHSLGGATANLLGARFNRCIKNGGWYGLTDKADLYVYTFAAIDSINTDGTVSRGYENIHNITNWHDSFGPNGWPALFSAKGRSRYGKFGHIDLFFDDRDHGEFNKADNHMMWTYLDAVQNNTIYYETPEYQKFAGFHCPVDIDVYRDGQLVGRVVNDTIDESVTSVPVAVEDSKKYIAMLDDSEYRFVVIASDNGTMSYSIVNMGTGEKDKEFVSVPLTPSKAMTSTVGGEMDASDVKLYVVDENDNPISEVNEDGTETPIFIIHNSPYTKCSGHSIYVEPIQQSSFDLFELSLSPEGDNPIQVEKYHLGFQVNIVSGQSSPSEYYMHLSDSFLDTLPAGTYYLWGIKDNQNTLIGSFVIEVADDVIATVNGTECRSVEEINAAMIDIDDPVITIIAERTIPYEPYTGSISITGQIPLEQSACVVIRKDATLDLNGGTVCGLVLEGTNLLVKDSTNGAGKVTGAFDLRDISVMYDIGGFPSFGTKHASLTVTGGSFISDFNVAQYLADGYTVESADGWDKVVPLSYIISYDANGGGGTPESQSKTHGEALTLADAVPSRTGWYFIGWAESPNAVDPDYPRPGGIFTRDADTILYAVWAQPDLVLPSAITEIGEEAFAGSAFRFASLPEHAVSIGPRAFADCSNLKYIFIHDKVTEIASDAFGNIKGITIFGGAPYQGVKTVAETYAEAHGFTFIPVYWRVPIYVTPQTPIIVE